MIPDNVLRRYECEVGICTGNPLLDSSLDMQQELKILSTIEQIWRQSVFTLFNTAMEDVEFYEGQSIAFLAWFDSLEKRVSHTLGTPTLEDTKTIKRLVSWYKIAGHYDPHWIAEKLSDPVFCKIQEIVQNNLPIPELSDVIQKPIDALQAVDCPPSQLEADLFQEDLTRQVKDRLEEIKRNREDSAGLNRGPPMPQASSLTCRTTTSVASCADIDSLAPSDSMPCFLTKSSELDATTQKIVHFIQTTLHRLCRAMLQTEMLCSLEAIETFIHNEVCRYFPHTEMCTIRRLTSDLQHPRYRLQHLLQTTAKQFLKV